VRHYALLMKTHKTGKTIQQGGSGRHSGVYTYVYGTNALGDSGHFGGTFLLKFNIYCPFRTAKPEQNIVKFREC